MKKFLLLALLALTLNCFSQTNFRFADSTAQWNVFTNENGLWCHCISYYTTLCYVVADTMVNNRDCQKMSDGSFIWKEDTGKVFRIVPSDTIRMLIYDFSKQKGDTFSLTNPDGNLAPNILCRVDSIDTAILDKPRKRMYITYNDDTWKPDVWIDGIGSLNSHFLFPGYDHTIIDGDAWSLLCFHENGNLIYPDTALQNCSMDTVVWLGIKEESAANLFNISPNPATPHLILQLQQHPSASTTFRLFDLTGRLIQQQPLTEKETRINVSGVNKGMYLFEVNVGGQQSGTGKVMVE